MHRIIFSARKGHILTSDFTLDHNGRLVFLLQDLLQDEEGEDAGNSLARSGLIHDQALMGKQATDIVIGALQKVSTAGFSTR